MLFLSYYISLFFFFKQNTAYELRISDWSSDVCFPIFERDLAHCPARRIDHVAADRRHRLAEDILRRDGREARIDDGAEMIERRLPLALVLAVGADEIGEQRIDRRRQLGLVTLEHSILVRLRKHRRFDLALGRSEKRS